MLGAFRRRLRGSATCRRRARGLVAEGGYMEAAHTTAGGGVRPARRAQRIVCVCVCVCV